MAKKQILVTGANSGIGKGLATTLARAGHAVILCARTLEKAEATRAELRAATGNADLDVLACDLGDLAAVHAAAQTVLARYPQLDALCNIAGSTFWKRAENAAGIEMNLAVNHLGPFLLTHMLLPALQAAPQGRIVNVVGEYHRKVRLDLDDLQWKRRAYSVMKSGSTAMLMRVMFTLELQRRLCDSSVSANCFHPGAVRSNLMKKFPWIYRALLGWVRIFFLSPEKGADTGYWLATAEEAGAHRGGYFIKRNAVPPSADAQDRAKAAALWARSAELVREATGGAVVIA